MKSRVIKICSVFAGIFIIIGMIVLVIDGYCFDRNFYVREYAQNKTTYVTGMSQEDLMDTTDVLLSYLRDKRDDLSVQHEVNGKMREVFNEREKAHMVDVKALYLNARAICYTLMAASLIFAAIALFVLKEKQSFLKGYMLSNLVIIIIFAGLGIYAAADFYSFWTNFHHIFFTNDLWLLDMNTDILIMMVPEQFFFDLVMKIAITVVAAMAVLFGGAFFWSRRLRRKSA